MTLRVRPADRERRLCAARWSRSVLTTFLRSICIALVTVVAACTSTPAPTAEATPAPTPPLTSLPSLGTLPPPSLPTGATPTPGTSPGPTATPPVTVSGSLASQLLSPLNQVLKQQRTNLAIPGITAAIIFPDGSMWSSAVGYAQISPQKRASVYTPFVVGSMSKTFVAATIMQLVDEGKLTLDDPLSNWLPSFPNAGAITLKMLLNHTSGVFNFYESPLYNKLAVRQGKGKSWTPQEVLDTFTGAPYCAPGTCYHYSNSGFILLGMVIEAVTGKSLGQNYEERFFTPLNLNQIWFQGDGPPPVNTARDYVNSGGSLVAVSDGTNYRPTQSEATVVWAAGEVVGSVRNMARWCKALYGGDVVSADSLAQMEAYVLHTSGDYGLGTRSRLYGSHRMFGHTGALRGFNGGMWYMPDLDITVAVMTNRAGIDTNPITDALLNVAVPQIH
jgi:D-alanyl-D-alanine carboxypeptidase